MIDEDDLVSQALDLPEAERLAFVDARCGSDCELKSRVVGLLQIAALISGNAGSDLWQSDFIPVGPTIGLGSADNRSNRSRSLASGMVFDQRYCLIKKIGEGGMGEVWVADQLMPIKRHVAIKVIRDGFESSQALLRFELERQTLAMLDHPSIAKVLDGGVEQSPNDSLEGRHSRPYFVMEWIQGVPLTKYCDELRLSVKERIRIFIAICMAVQHAHQKGIIHRDLKPSNIIVAIIDDKPVPKVIDFGIAKVLGMGFHEDTPRTQIGTLIGTLEYMSPEQAEPNNLDIDTRSDIYSLGVILYELLTSVQPFTRQSLRELGFAEMLRVLQQVEPPKPSTRISSSLKIPDVAAARQMEPKSLAAFLRGDLDWIVMCSLEKDRARRYATAIDFASDLERFLANEPVSAHPPSIKYRLFKLLRRHRGKAIAIVLVVLSLFAGVVGTTRGMLMARIESVKAAEAQEIAMLQAKVASGERDKALLAEMESQKQATISRAVRDFLQSDLLGQANIFVRAKDLNGISDKSDRLKPDPTIRQLLDRVAHRFDDPNIKNKLTPEVEAELFEVIGNTYRSIGELEKAIDFLNRGAKLFEAVYGSEDPRTLCCLVKLGRARLQSSDSLAAIQILESAVTGLRHTLGAKHLDTLDAESALAWSLRSAGRNEAAILLSESILSRWESIPDSTIETLKILDDLSWAYKDVDRLPEALSISEQIVPKFIALVGDEHPNTLIAMHHLSWIYWASGKQSEAIETNEATWRGRIKVYGPEHSETLWAIHTLAEFHFELMHFDKAIELGLQVFNGRKKALGELHAQTISCQYQLAIYYLDSSDETEGLAQLVELSKVLEKSNYQSTRSIEILKRLADCLDKQAGDSSEIRNRIDKLMLRNDSNPSPKD